VDHTSKDDTFSAELESRLDELFREDDPPAKVAKPGAEASHPLTELKKIVLSIDWEITPEALDSFQEQVNLLKETYRRDQVVFSLLQILGVLGQHIQSSRSNAHPGTFTVLNSVFALLEDILNSPNMEGATKRRLLQAALQSYQKLRDKVMQRRAAKSPGPITAAVATTETSASEVVTRAMLNQAVQELKEFMQNEINGLKDQIKAGATRG
jgi:pilus assembly protein FimV